jgi:hypothetical protein
MWEKSKAVDAKEGCYFSASLFAMLTTAAYLLVNSSSKRSIARGS